jgi:hypothetical protein
MGINASHNSRNRLASSKSVKKRRTAAVATVLASTVFIQNKFSADFNKQAKMIQSSLAKSGWMSCS